MRNISRRDFLKGTAALSGAVLLPGAAMGLLDACSAAVQTPAQAQRTPVDFQLGWIANVENMGEFMADSKGYYSDEGLAINLVPGGPTVSAEPIVVSGKALIGLSGSDVVARARLQGAKLKIIAATFQKNPSAVMSLASNPIRTPQDLIGKRLGIQQSGVPVYNAFFKVNGIDPKSITYVPVEFDPAPLVSGQVDAFAAFQTNQPIALQLQGIKTVTFLLADYNFNLFQDVLEVTEDTLSDKTKRALALKTLRATIRGWEAAIADPGQAASLVVNDYGKNLKLDLQSQTLTAKAEVPLIQTSETEAHGLLTMSAADIDQNMETMKLEGVQGVTAQDLFDTSLLSEVFNGSNRV
jgi:ABC-type nitrate/sulfonate/bicarbonate transport system substrate-binding protein